MAAVGIAEPAAILLTGGRSSRMGTDKATLVVDGKSLQQRVHDALVQAGVSIIAVADAAKLPDPGPDGGGPSQGPMAGIVSGWRSLCAQDNPYDPVVVLSCDLPSITPEVIVALLAEAELHQHGAAAHDGERAQPLIAAYRPAALDDIEAAYARGERSVRRCFAGWRLGQVTFDRARLMDADTPDDLKGFSVQWPT